MKLVHKRTIKKMEVTLNTKLSIHLNQLIYPQDENQLKELLGIIEIKSIVYLGFDTICNEIVHDYIVEYN